jgi:hypothetical protein
MDLENKLKGIPHIYYFNLDNRTDRKQYMENQFNNWGIKNYTRISSTKYLASKLDEWRHLVIGDIYYWGQNSPVTANAMCHIEFINWWVNETDDEYVILMEDDYDLNLIEYWHFDWEYLMNNIPYDWDCIQLGYESDDKINFFLCPKPSTSTFFGPCMINKRYAKKIVDLHYKDNKFLFNNKVNKYSLLNQGGGCTVDYFMCENGRTYCIPLITTNNDIFSYEENVPRIFEHHVKSRELYYYWWKNERDNFTLEDFFIYGKPYDDLMTLKINYE